MGDRPNPALLQAELSLEEIQTLLPREFLKQLTKVYLCGNYGDPMVAKDLIPIIEYLKQANPDMTVGIHTNGSGRDQNWWHRLAEVVDYCRFAIDGLGDTNHIYRRNTNWDKIMSSVNTFVAAGGRAEWDYIVFKHNEHQVEDARALADSLGFALFNVKPTSRFFSHVTGEVESLSPIIDRYGETIAYLEMPEDPQWKNATFDRLAFLAGQSNGYSDYLDSTPIRCKVAASKSLYMTAEGLIAPCCWLGSFYRSYRRSGDNVEFLELLPNGKDSIDPRKSSIEAIVNGPVFQDIVPTSWEANSVETGRLEHCSRICGSIDAQGAQHRRQEAFHIREQFNR